MCELHKHECEITPAMIEAGIREIADFDPTESPEHWREIVVAIFRAMSAQPTSK
jgi:hypothetical protein